MDDLKLGDRVRFKIALKYTASSVVNETQNDIGTVDYHWEGYRRAGFIPTGVDINRQPNYLYQFVRCDALEYLQRYGHEFDFIHASPPCQAHTQLKRMHKNDPAYLERHVDLIADTRRLLQASGKPYVIENVPGAPLLNPIVLCGSQFGLKVYRHRLFESNVMLFQPSHIPHDDKTPSAGRGASPKGFISVAGNGGAQGLDVPYLEYVSRAMGIGWMSRAEISQAVPPVFTEYIGKQIMRYLAQQKLCT